VSNGKLVFFIDEFGLERRDGENDQVNGRTANDRSAEKVWKESMSSSKMWNQSMSFIKKLSLFRGDKYIPFKVLPSL
jgi:hypothetical protein